MTSRVRPTHASRRGTNLVEFALVAFLLSLGLMVFVDFGRLMLVYNGVSNSARAGVRYAIVHGENRSAGGGPDGQSGPGATTEVESVVRRYASSAALDVDRLAATCTPGGDGRVCVEYPENCNSIRCMVRITVVYRYDPFVGYFPLTFNLNARSEGRIVY